MVKNSKFQTFIVENELDFQACMHVLEVVRRQELNRVAGTSVLDSSSFMGEDIRCKLMACRDLENNKIIGCIRITPASEVSHLESSRREYKLDSFPDWLLPKIIILTRLAILPVYRNSPVALLLTSHSFNYHLENGGQGMLGICEPNLYTMYLKLGMQPMGPMYNSYKLGYRIPLVVFYDSAHFDAVNNPALRTLNKFNDECYKEIKEWYSNLRAKELPNNEVGIYQYTPNDEDRPLFAQITSDISESGVKRLMRNAVKIVCEKGDMIIPRNDGGNFIGIVIHGEVHVKKDGRTLAILKRGNLFGELALITGIYRTANVLAKTANTEVIILSRTALNMPTIEDELKIWKNLANIVAKKLLAMNN